MKTNIELQNALAKASLLYSIVPANKIGADYSIPIINVNPQIVDNAEGAFTLESAAQLTMKKVRAKTAVFRFVLSYRDLRDIRDLNAFFASTLRDFAKKSGFERQEKFGQVWGACSPTYKNSGSEGVYWREREASAELEFRMYTDFAEVNRG